MTDPAYTAGRGSTSRKTVRAEPKKMDDFLDQFSWEVHQIQRSTFLIQNAQALTRQHHDSGRIRQCLADAGRECCINLPPQWGGRW